MKRSIFALSTLVILGASITGLAVARDAHQHGLRPIVVDSEHGPAFDSRWVISVGNASPTEEVTLARICELGGSDHALISTSDHWSRWLVEHRVQLASSFGTIVQPANATLGICLDKVAFSDWCATEALPTPATWVPQRTSRPSSLRFPMLLRPTHAMPSHRSSGIPKAVQARDEAELNQWLQRYADAGVTALVSESLLRRPLEQYSVPFARSGERILMFTARKIRPAAELCQTGTYVQMCIDEPAERLARVAIERLDYFGIGEVEILRDTRTGENYLIEINARPWLQYALAPASRHDFLGLVLGLPMGDSNVARVGKAWIDIRQDLFVAFSHSIGMVRHRRLGLGAYLQSLVRGNVFAVFDWRDPYPFLASLRR